MNSLHGRFQMRVMATFAIALLGLIFLPTLVLADNYFFNPALHYRNSKAISEFSGGKSETSTTTSQLNATAGYSFSSGLLLGLKYFGEQQGADVIPISGDQERSLIDLRVSATGAGIGFLVEGVSFFLSVLAIKAPEKIDQNQKVEYHSGSGTILDFAYYTKFGDLLVGPQLSWRSFEFKEYRFGGTQADPIGGEFVKLKEQHIEPYLSLLFLL